MEWSILSSFIHHKLITLFKNNNNNNVQWRGYFKINLNPIKSLLFFTLKKMQTKILMACWKLFHFVLPKMLQLLGLVRPCWKLEHTPSPTLLLNTLYRTQLTKPKYLVNMVVLIGSYNIINSNSNIVIIIIIIIFFFKGLKESSFVDREICYLTRACPPCKIQL